MVTPGPLDEPVLFADPLTEEEMDELQAAVYQPTLGHHLWSCLRLLRICLPAFLREVWRFARDVRN